MSMSGWWSAASAMSATRCTNSMPARHVGNWNVLTSASPGRLTELLGAPGTGKTTLTRRLVARALADGVWVAYVDAARTLDARDWAPLTAASGPLWVVRPAEAARGAWCADVLLRSGAFGLV